MNAFNQSASDQPVAPAQRPQSLGRRLVLATLAFCVVFTVAAVGLRTWAAWQHNLAAMTAELELIDKVFQRPLARSLWDMDRDELQTHLSSVSQVSPVGRVELRILRAGRSPEILERQNQGAPRSSLAPAMHRQLTYQPAVGAVEMVGELTLEGDERVLWARLKAEVLAIVITQVVQSLLLAGLIMWLFNRTVTVHVERIASHLDRVTPANLQHSLELQRKVARPDELSLLQAGVNQLQAKLGEYLERQRRDECDLAAHRDHLAELVAEQTTELRAANAQLQELSQIDPLTGLANRRHFDAVKDAEFRRAQRLNQPLSALVCDVDYFKRYNDRYGHAQGDVCLKLVADALKKNFSRAGEFVARIGGEEFAVLLPGCTQEQAWSSAQRLCQAVVELGIPHVDSQVAFHVTLSVGVAQFDPATMDCFETLLNQADQALYRAKNRGRNRVSV